MIDFSLKAHAPGELLGVTLTPLDRPLRVQAGEHMRVAISVTNGSSVTLNEWRFFTGHQLYLAYMWGKPGVEQPLPPDFLMTSIWRPLRPGEHRTIHTRVHAPAEPGTYFLWIMLVQHGALWYDSNSEVKPVLLEVEVLEKLDVSPHSINDYEDSVYSQSGEDGMLREIFLRLGYTDPFAVEFGVGDGMECNTAMWLREYRWRGLLIEGNPEDFERIRSNYRNYPGVTVANHYVGVDNIVELFERYGVPKEFDLLSIDVDGNDYWLWEALASYRPHVVIIEMNRAIKPPQLWVMEYDPAHEWDPHNNRFYYGASLESYARLGKRLGYALVGTNQGDINAVFVRADLLERVRFPELSATEAYHWVEHTPPGYEKKFNGPFVEQ